MTVLAHTLERPRTALPGGLIVIGVLAALGVLAIGWRLVFGLGATTALTDAYPWGLWIAFDVVTGTALACGGYAIAIMVYILNRGQYHPLVRPALLTSAFGYTLAGMSVALDVGRYWGLWKVPIYFWRWNLNSVLLEVALCIMAYTAVLWIELSPAFLERGTRAASARVRRFSESALPKVKRALPWIVAVGLLLPTMHQSSLGSAAVVLEGALSSLLLRRRMETRMLASIGRAALPVFWGFVLLRIGDLVWRGQLPALLALDRYSIMALLELALFVAPLLMLATERQRLDTGNLFRSAMVLALAGGLYRIDTFLVAFNPGAQHAYFPSVGEILITTGLVSFEILGYILIVRYFPILSAQPQTAAVR
jgi:Ni/Fe-hydrogenase subunit HybB-like protein